MKKTINKYFALKKTLDISHLNPAQANFVRGLVAHSNLLDRLINFTQTFAETHYYCDCKVEDCEDCYGDSSERDNKEWRDRLFNDIWSQLECAKFKEVVSSSGEEEDESNDEN